MSGRRALFLLLIVMGFMTMAAIPFKSQYWGRVTQNGNSLIAGQNINMVHGTSLPGGDPFLQRQNEPSIAVSTRNTMHLLAGANDYRTVDFPGSEGALPGEVLSTAEGEGDAWLGVFKSFDGGQTWSSSLLPGYHYYDTTPSYLKPNPLYGFTAAADPTVRAGTNGLFYYSGIAFDREENGDSVLFVSRFQDDNNKELGDTIRYLGTSIIDAGTSGQFTDKPWIAVDQPQSSYAMGIFNNQSVSCGNVYIVYSMFVGNDVNNVHNKILFSRSLDCGVTWSNPIKLSESQHVNQGTTIAIDPANGHVYVAWRRFAAGQDADAIIISKSEDFGQTFSKATEVAHINPFDQGTTEFSFRTSTLPALAAYNGTVYVAWSERGLGQQGTARVLVTSSTNGGGWTAPSAIDAYEGSGHQFMPSLTFAAGKLMAAWFDQRDDISNDFDYHIEDSQIRHTIDVRTAIGEPGQPPSFEPSIRVSRYLYTLNGMVLVQSQWNFPNLPLFKGGTVPFIGDYIDLAPSPRFVFENGAWRFNGAALQIGAVMDQAQYRTPLYHVAWTDNRDVYPPGGDWWGDWTQYTPINVQNNPCNPACTGMRNQDVYTSRISQGLVVESPGNTKPLNIPRTFVVIVKNTTPTDKYFKLTIDSPYVNASFFPLTEPAEDVLDVPIAAFSSASLPVFVVSLSSGTYASLWIYVEETNSGGTVLPNGLKSFVVLNPDHTNPLIENPDVQVPPPNISEFEFHTPNIRNLSIVNWGDVNVSNPNIPDEQVYSDEYMNSLINPDIVNPNSPDISENEAANPNIRNPNIRNSSLEGLTDIEWTVKNKGNTTSSYTFNLVSTAVAGEEPQPLPDPQEEDQPFYAQLLVYRVYETPVDNNCNLETEEHHELILNIVNPNFVNPFPDPNNPNYENPNIRNPNIRNPNIRNATFFLPPEEEGRVILRVFDKRLIQGSSTLSVADTGEPFDPNTVGAAFVAHAPDPNDVYYDFPPQIITTALPDGAVDIPYSATLTAFGDKGNLTWSLDDPMNEPLPDGLNLISNNGTAELKGTPSVSGLFVFKVKVTDEVSGKFDIQMLSITIQNTYTLSVDAYPGGAGTVTMLPDKELYMEGEEVVLTAEANANFSFAQWSGDASGTENPLIVHMTGDKTITANFVGNAVTISGKVKLAEGLTPLEGVIMEGFADTITTDADGDYTAVVPYGWSGTVTPKKPGYVFSPPSRTYEYSVSSIPNEDYMASLREEWVRRYNNDSLSGDEEATAIAVDSAGNIYITGYSTGRTTGPDIYTIKYNSAGDFQWGHRYDGPSHLGDYGTAIAVWENSPGDPFIFVAGYVHRGNKVAHADYCLLKYDNSGNLLWDETYDARRNGNDVPLSLALDNSGNVYMTGMSEESLEDDPEKTHDYLTAKYSSSGKLLWEKRYEGKGIGQDDVATAIAVYGSGVYVTGYSSNGLNNDYVTIKYDLDGNEAWTDFPENVARYDGSGDDKAFAIAVNGSGVYVTGYSSNGLNNDYVTVKYDLNGHEAWTNLSGNVARYDGSGDDKAFAIAANSSAVIVTGSSFIGADNDFVTIKYDLDGNEVWEDPVLNPKGIARYDNGNDDIATAVILYDSGNICVTGKSEGNGTHYDFFTIKYDSSGVEVWSERYNGPASGIDYPAEFLFNGGGNIFSRGKAIAIDHFGNVIVTGSSQGVGTSKDYATVKYIH